MRELFDLDIDLNGYGFINGRYFIFVDCRGLPEEFGIHLFESNEGEVLQRVTHESTEAAEIVNNLMDTHT